MATATALGLQVARRARDASQGQVTAAAYLDFINMAIDDLKAAGWLQPQVTDTSITLAAEDFHYAIPSGFAYIQKIVIEDENDEYPENQVVPEFHWSIVLDAADTPAIYFDPHIFDLLIPGRSVKIFGQKRPTGNLSGSDTIVPGMESFVRERALAYALEYMADSTSETSQLRAQRAGQAWAKSEKMLGQHPMEFRVKPSSRYVLGR